MTSITIIAKLTLVLAFSWPSISRANGTVGLKNYRELYETMSYLTSISSTSVREYFEKSKNRLSQTGSVADMNASLLLTSNSLAAAFCEELVKQEERSHSKDRIFFGEIDFRETQSSLTLELVNRLVDRLAQRFWQRAPTSRELDLISNEMIRSSDGLAESTGQLKTALTVGCSLTLSSLNVITN